MTQFESISSALNASNPTPLYQQLQKALRGAIEDNVWAPEDFLPAERELAQALDVSRITVRKAVDGLVREGLVARRQGAGTFVTSRVEKNFAKLSSFSEDITARGQTPGSQWLKREAGLVTPEEALLLALSPGSPVYRFHRIRFADDSTMALEYTTVPAFCLPSPSVVDTSLYVALDEAGYRPTRALQVLRAVLFDKKQADLLGISAGDPGLRIERRGFAGDDKPIEITRSYYRGDAYDFVAELSAGDG